MAVSHSADISAKARETVGIHPRDPITFSRCTKCLILAVPRQGGRVFACAWCGASEEEGGGDLNAPT